MEGDTSAGTNIQRIASVTCWKRLWSRIVQVIVALKEVMKLSDVSFLYKFIADNLIQADLAGSRRELFHVAREADGS